MFCFVVEWSGCCCSFLVLYFRAQLTLTSSTTTRTHSTTPHHTTSPHLISRSSNMAFKICECLVALGGNMNASYSVGPEKFLELESAVCYWQSWLHPILFTPHTSHLVTAVVSIYDMGPLISRHVTSRHLFVVVVVVVFYCKTFVCVFVSLFRRCN